MTATTDEDEAKDRLSLLLDFTQEIAGLGRRDSGPVTALESSPESNQVVIHEYQLRELQELRTTDAQPAITLSGNGASGATSAAASSGGDSTSAREAAVRASAWLTLRRPDRARPIEAGSNQTEAQRQRLSKKADEMYASLFAARQESLRTGQRAQLTVGVGLVRWTTSDGTVVDHPLVQIPVELQLANDGALIIRMADAAKASLWLFPGVDDAAPALAQLDTCAKDYGLVGTLSPPAPTDRDAWAPLLERAAHVLSPDARYIVGPPVATQPKKSDKRRKRGRKPKVEMKASETPTVHNTFVLFTRDVEAQGEQTISRDAAALARALRSVPRGMLPAALGRLVGVYGLPVAPGSAPPADDPRAAFSRGNVVTNFFRRLFSGKDATEKKNPASAESKAPFLYFGLPSNTEQESVVARLEAQGCAVLVGPPGTGKSQTIANVICHYLASGRRVLVTSKGEPATEVLRNKLPEGIRDLCVSLGSGDTASFRRLEGAVESLANQVAAAPLRKLRADADRLRKRFHKVQSDIDRIQEADARWASGYFPPADGDTHPLAILRPLLHSTHLEILGVQESSTMAQLAAAIEGVLGPSFSSAVPSRSEKAVTSTHHGLLPAKAFFLEDVRIDPTQPPPATELVDSLRSLRRKCGNALRWETTLMSRSAQARKAEALDVQDCRVLALRLRERNKILESVKIGDLPTLSSIEDGKRLESQLQRAYDSLLTVQNQCQRIILSKHKIDRRLSAFPQPKRRHTGARRRHSADSLLQQQSENSSALANPSWVYDLLRHSDNKRAQQAMANINFLVAKLDKLYATSASSANTVDSSSKRQAGGQSPHTDNGDKKPVARHGVTIPRVLLRLVDLPIKHDLNLNERTDDFVGKVIGENEFSTEVCFRAHPEKRGFFSSWRGTKPSQTLMEELADVVFDGKNPTTPHDWQNVEQALVERCCGSRLQEQWEMLSTIIGDLPELPCHVPESSAWVKSPRLLDTFSPLTLPTEGDKDSENAASGDQPAPAGLSDLAPLTLDSVALGDNNSNTSELPTPRINAGLQQSQAVQLEPAQQFVDFIQTHRTLFALAAKAMDACKGLSDSAAAAHGKALRALNAVSRGPETVKSELERLRTVLKASNPDMTAAVADRDALLAELQNCERGSPVDVLRAATEALGRLDISAETATRNWQAARNQLRQARGQLKHAQTLRHRAQADLRSIAPAWAKHLTEFRTSALTETQDDADEEGPPNEKYWDPIPREAREIWSAIAAKTAMKDSLLVSERERGSENGALAAQRLLIQRDAIVRSLVAAVAKEALRKEMSDETSAGLIRLVSAVVRSPVLFCFAFPPATYTAIAAAYRHRTCADTRHCSPPLAARLGKPDLGLLATGTI